MESDTATSDYDGRGSMSVGVPDSIAGDERRLSLWFADANKAEDDLLDENRPIQRFSLDASSSTTLELQKQRAKQRRQTLNDGFGIEKISEDSASTMDDKFNSDIGLDGLPFKPILYEAKLSDTNASSAGGKKTKGKKNRRSTAFATRGTDNIEAALEKSRVESEKEKGKGGFGRRVSQIYNSVREAMPKIKGLKSRAEKDDFKAQYELSQRYLEGKGVSRDIERYMYWLHRAADTGHPMAANNLAVMYASGSLVEENHAKSLEYFIKAAEGGLARAQLQVALLYSQGSNPDDPRTKDYEQAFVWYQKAAESGSRTALNNLASMYLVGRGTPQNFQKAAELFQQAANDEDSAAQWNLAQMVKFGLGCEKDETAGNKLLETAKRTSKAAISMPLPTTIE